MPRKYDDWGNPVGTENEQQRQPGISGLVNSLSRMIRLYSPVIFCAIVATALYLFFGYGEPKPQPIDWSLFAYVQYATDNHNMCNSYMVFEALHRFGSKADRVLMYPSEWDDVARESETDRNMQLMVRAEANYKVKLIPIDVIDDGGKAKPGTLREPSSWDTSITKLRAFELDQYERVLHLDSDITLRQHLDELFLLPKTQMAMPRAYWSNEPPGKQPLTSLLMLLEPNRVEFQNFLDILQTWKLDPDYKVNKKYDMDLVNHRFGGSAMVLPHRPYALLSAEFRRSDHDAYLGVAQGPKTGHLPARMKWDAQRVLEEAKVVHFSDWPLPKPWVMWPTEGLMEMQPDCGGSFDTTCPERKVWKGLYDDFRKRRKELCRMLSSPAPKWEDFKNRTGAA